MMKQAMILAGAALLCCMSAPSQTYRTSPSDFETREGDREGLGLGAFPAGRYMCFDGGYRGTPMTIKGTAYRYDDRVYNSTTTGLGRSWTNVEIFAAECDVAKRSSTYSLNPVTTPTRVFSANVTWPDFTGKPLHRPADFTLQFPFQSSWVYSGTNDISFDYQFAGGVLSNNGTWSTSVNNINGYYKDAETAATEYTNRSVSLGKWGSMFGSCSDRGARSTQGAWLILNATYYGTNYSAVSYRNRIALRQDGQAFGVSVPVVTILGVRADRSGIAFPGVTCNRIHVDLSLPTLAFRQISTTGGSLPRLTFGAPANGVPGDPSWSGVELVTQAAWEDSRTRALLFSGAAQVFIPTQPRDFKRSCVWGPTTTKATGSGPTTSFRYNEIARYTN